MLKNIDKIYTNVQYILHMGKNLIKMLRETLSYSLLTADTSENIGLGSKGIW